MEHGVTLFFSGFFIGRAFGLFDAKRRAAGTTCLVAGLFGLAIVIARASA